VGRVKIKLKFITIPRERKEVLETFKLLDIIRASAFEKRLEPTKEINNLWEERECIWGGMVLSGAV